MTIDKNIWTKILVALNEENFTDSKVSFDEFESKIEEVYKINGLSQTEKENLNYINLVDSNFYAIHSEYQRCKKKVGYEKANLEFRNHFLNNQRSSFFRPIDIKPISAFNDPILLSYYYEIKDLSEYARMNFIDVTEYLKLVKSCHESLYFSELQGYRSPQLISQLDAICLQIDTTCQKLPNSNFSQRINGIQDHYKSKITYRTYSIQSHQPSDSLDTYPPKHHGTWMWDEVEITGLKYKVPVYFHGSSGGIKQTYKDAIKIAFELLKSFILSDDLHDFLLNKSSQSYSHPLTICIGPDPDDEFTSGKYIASSNRIFLTVTELKSLVWFSDYKKALQPSDLWELTIVEKSILGTLLHELGHAFANYYFDSKNPQPNPNWLAVKALYVDSMKRIMPDGYTDSDFSKLTNAQTIDAPKTKDSNYLYYAPYAHQKRFYALKNEHEFFAELFKEFFMYQLSKVDSENLLNEEWNILEKNKFFKSRIKIMTNLFAPYGINPNAFSKRNIRRVYGIRGIEFTDEFYKTFE